MFPMYREPLPAREISKSLNTSDKHAMVFADLLSPHHAITVFWYHETIIGMIRSIGLRLSSRFLLQGGFYGYHVRRIDSVSLSLGEARNIGQAQST